MKTEGWRAARSSLGYLPLWPRMPPTKARLGHEPSQASLYNAVSVAQGGRED